MQGSSKSVQRAKFLVTQALNTPSTMAQPTPGTSTATTVNAAASDRADTSTSSGSPVRGNYAAIPSSSSEWPTITQANTMAQQSQSSKSASKGGKLNDDSKESAEPNDPSPVIDDVFEEDSQGLPEKNEVNLADENQVPQSDSPEKSVTNTTVPWSASSAWKPCQSGPQTVGMCTSAVTTSTSSVVMAVTGISQHMSGREMASGNGLNPNYPSASPVQDLPSRGDMQSSCQNVSSVTGLHVSRVYEVRDQLINPVTVKGEFGCDHSKESSWVLFILLT